MAGEDQEILTELRAHTGALTSIGKALESQGEVLNQVASSLVVVLERQRSSGQRFRFDGLEASTPEHLRGYLSTFAVVIISLAGLFFSQQQGQDDLAEIRDNFQKERTVALDTLLQKELAASAQALRESATQNREWTEARLKEIDLASGERHVEQQRELAEIKSWFKPPSLKTNGGN